MEEVDANALLDYVVFEISSGNRYEAHLCSQGNIEKLPSGSLDLLAFHLPEAKAFISNQSCDFFKLQPHDDIPNPPCFTKSTLISFLDIVNSPEVLKISNAIENEISQLEATKRFHLTLYYKDIAADIADMHDIQDRDDQLLSDDTKNELLRAMDSRLEVLKEELITVFNRAADATFSVKQISDLLSFAEHFGAVHLRNSLTKLLSEGLKDEPTNPTIDHFIRDSRCISKPEMQMAHRVVSYDGMQKPLGNGISPAKIAQAERHSSDSDESSDSSDEYHAPERSRRMARSSTPRRSASPMRRIQIGRSGSRRSVPLTIKSLNYFPTKDKTTNQDTQGNDNVDVVPDQSLNKHESNVRRMSVQDAISLFESKQPDKDSESQKTKTLLVSNSMNKSVLRRWSSGMSDSFSHKSVESSTDCNPYNTTTNLDIEAENKADDMKVEAENDDTVEQPGGDDSVQENALNKEMASSPADNLLDINMPKTMESNDHVANITEWSRQKETELNLMLTKMMENKPAKYRGTAPISKGHQDISSEKRGGFYSQYKERRDEKLRGEKAGKGSALEAQFKVMQQKLEQSKAEMALKNGGVKGKKDLPKSSQRPTVSQRPVRNSLSPVTCKIEDSKSINAKKASTKAALPATRISWPSGQLPRTSGVTPAKSPASSTINRSKSQPVPSPLRPSPRVEKPLHQPKGRTGTASEVNPPLKGQQSTQQKTATKTKRIPKNREATSESTVPQGKPSFYGKVTKKSTVVPLEAKPFLKKGTKIGPGVGPVVPKTKVSQSDESSKNVDLPQDEKDCLTVTTESKTPESELVQPTNSDNVNLITLTDNDMVALQTSYSIEILAESNNDSKEHLDLQPDVNPGISSAAWEETEKLIVPNICENIQSQKTAVSPKFEPFPSTSPHVHHSLSQMLQADSCEPEIIEWGNAENPPALVYQKDSPKGLKRLLKFARKSKAEQNVAGWASPVFSEGEDDQEESKTTSKRNSDSLLRKSTLQSMGCNQQHSMLSGSFDGRTSSKRQSDNQGSSNMFPAQSGMTGSVVASKSREQASESAAAKATRSFFSLSTFRSSKSSEAKV